MGFLDKFTKPSPQVQQLIELQKQQLKKEAEDIRGEIAAHRDEQMARINDEHAARVAPIEASIAARQQEMRDMGKRALFNIACMSLLMNLSSEFTRSLARGEIGDIRATMNEVRTSVQTRIDALKDNPTNATLDDLETWATERAGNNERSLEKVSKAFSVFRSKLQQDGITLG